MKGVEPELFNSAKAVLNRAYANYSKFRVGAVLVGADGQHFQGCNVENISFGLTMCAERVALGSAIAAGVRDFSLLVLMSDSGEPIVPCGACRQVLAEFSPELRIFSRTLKGQTAEFSLSSLLPLPRQGILD